MTYSRPLALLVALATALGLLALVGSPASAATTWKPAAAVSGDTEGVARVRTTMSADGKSVATVWRGEDDQGNQYVQVVRSTDGGNTWSAAQDLFRGVTTVRNLQMAASDDGQTLLVAWIGDVAGDSGLLTRSSTDGGATWRDVKAVMSTTKIFNNYDMAMTPDGTTVTVAFEEIVISSPTQGTVSAASSVDSGLTWTAPELISTPGIYCHQPQVAMSDSGRDLAVVWSESTNTGSVIATRFSANGGQFWGVTGYLDGTLENNREPQVAMSSTGRRLHLLWFTSAFGVSAAVVVTSSNDGGATWEPNVEFGNADFLGPASLITSADGSRATGIWGARENGTESRIRSISTSDSGATWTSARSMTPNDEPGFNPEIAASADGSRVTAVWQTQPLEGRPSKTKAAELSLVLATSTSNGGVDWEPVSTLYETNAHAVYPQIAVSQDSTSLIASWHREDGVARPSTRDGVITGQVWAAVGTTLNPTPTPTPTPTPVPEKRAQKPASAKGRPPARIARDGVTVITGRDARTNAGQLIRTRVRCVPLQSVAAGETRYCTVNRGPKGKVALRTYGRDVRVIVVQVAGPTAEYKAYRKRTVYVDGRKR